MCECRKTIEAKLKNRFEIETPQATGHEVTLEGYTFVIGERVMTSRPCMPFKKTAFYKQKNGVPKFKTSRENIIFNFCPFCGEKQS
jgi:hypothetical protein